MRKALSLFLAICLLTLTITSCTSAPTDDELIEERIDRFLSAFNMGNEDEILKCFSTAEQQRIAEDNIEDALWVAIALGLGIETVGDTAKLSDIAISGSGDNQAYANVSLTCQTDGDSYSSQVIFLLVKERNDWFIENYENVG